MVNLEKNVLATNFSNWKISWLEKECVFTDVDKLCRYIRLSCILNSCFDPMLLFGSVHLVWKWISIEFDPRKVPLVNMVLQFACCFSLCRDHLTKSIGMNFFYKILLCHHLNLVTQVFILRWLTILNKKKKNTFGNITSKILLE